MVYCDEMNLAILQLHKFSSAKRSNSEQRTYSYSLPLLSQKKNAPQNSRTGITRSVQREYSPSWSGLSATVMYSTTKTIIATTTLVPKIIMKSNFASFIRNYNSNNNQLLKQKKDYDKKKKEGETGNEDTESTFCSLLVEGYYLFVDAYHYDYDNDYSSSRSFSSFLLNTF